MPRPLTFGIVIFASTDISPVLASGSDPQHGKDAEAGSEDNDDLDGVFQL